MKESEPTRSASAVSSPGGAIQELRARMLVGGAWIMLGTGGGAILRLVSSMVLTRLLFPADFGLVATAGLLTTALEMFSDLGIRQALVQHPHGDSRSFLNTAFVMALCRGAALGLFMWILARPFASFFGDYVRFCGWWQLAR